jgi:hypothetical protein
VTPALDRALLTRHPGMLIDLEHGFDHGDGWFRVVARMLELLEPHGVRLLQIKQKHGLLRVYVDRYDPEIRGIIDDAERRSGHICERCGFGDWSGLTGGCAGCEP